MIDLPLRISGALAGLAMVLAFLHSALQVAVINREKGRLARVPRRLARSHDFGTPCTEAAKLRPDTRCAGVGHAALHPSPYSGLVCSGAGWVFAADMVFPAEHSVLQAVIASDSALSTLGFLTLPGIAGQLLAIPEGAMGLGIVVFFFTFIPGYQTAIQAGEVRVAWLYARAGIGMANFGLVEWLQRSGRRCQYEGQCSGPAAE